MSAAPSASRTVHAQASMRAPAPRVARAAAPALQSDRDDQFKVNLADIPRQPESLEIEGFKPSLLSRLLNAIAPIR